MDPYASSEFDRMMEQQIITPPPSPGGLLPEDGCELSDDEFNEILESPCASCRCWQ